MFLGVLWACLGCASGCQTGDSVIGGRITSGAGGRGGSGGESGAGGPQGGSVSTSDGGGLIFPAGGAGGDGSVGGAGAFGAGSAGAGDAGGSGAGTSSGQGGGGAGGGGGVNIGGDALFVRSFGGPLSQEVRAVACTEDGGLVLVGRFSGTVDFGTGGVASAGLTDAFVVKLDADGTVAFARTIGDSAAQSADRVAIAPNGDIVVAGTMSGSVDFGGGAIAVGSGRVFVAAWTAGGSFIFAKAFPGSGAHAAGGVGVTTAGDIAVAGTFTGTVLLGGSPLQSAGASDVFVGYYGATGDYIAGARYGDAKQQEARGLTIDASDGLLLTGVFEGALSFGAPAPSLYSAGNWDAFVAAFDVARAPVWALKAGDTGAQFGEAVALAPSGDVYMAGSFSGAMVWGTTTVSSSGVFDAFVLTASAQGSPQTGARYGDALGQLGKAIDVAGDGRVALGGSFFGDINLGGGTLSAGLAYDGYVGVFDGVGAPRYSRKLGGQVGAADEHVRALCFRPDGELWVAGDMYGRVTTEAGTALSEDELDIFVVRLGL